MLSNTTERNTKEENILELWRWKMIRKVADYINQPDDINMPELKAMSKALITKF